MTESTEHTLARIERALENWERGPDVMQWTPRMRSRAEREAASAEQIERMREAMRPLNELFSGLQAIAEQQAQHVSEVMRQLAGALTATRADFVLVPGEPEQSCHCLCLHNHKGRELCQGDTPVSAAEIMRYRTALTGEVEVPMCPPCAEAVLAAHA
ncbi:MAG TPA: hypothetical protein VE172_08065 [Stackebrandtia sp.]|jgi:hypothetical protein|uniref:hypothetical protein n=1 Tax=Stackebrandtia sp. TaxID=2023065 RepID=UPI002D3AAE67|nr:hypothetical protein [Stackebrandtia sp.]HZE38753.1 hypothetical protein [Stackebrandtia sp.]